MIEIGLGCKDEKRKWNDMGVREKRVWRVWGEDGVRRLLESYRWGNGERWKREGSERVGEGWEREGKRGKRCEGV